MTNNGIDFSRLRKQLHERGVFCLRSFLPRDKVIAAREATRERMQEAGIWDGSLWQTQHLQGEPINAGAKLGRKLKGCEEFDNLVQNEIPLVVAELLVQQPTFVGMKVPQPLFTLPNATEWQVPHNVWHLDVPRFPNCDIPGVQVFTFLETVKPEGGGTLVVAGSHRMLNNVEERMSSKDVKQKLKKEPYFRELMSKHTTNRNQFMRSALQCGDVKLQVVEMHGEPGDVYFVDLRTLHTPAPNATSVPRIMLTRRYFLESIREQFYAPAKTTAA